MIGSAHESAGEIHRQIAASATGAAIAASDIVITDVATLTARSAIATPTDDRRTKAIAMAIWLKPPMIVRPLFVLLIWAPGCPGLPGLPESP